jgi:hypothetical protein
MLRLDHLAVTARTLAEGAAAVEDALGLPLGAVGLHPAMATHNRLIGCGDLYLEVIAPDPAAPHPGRPRWFRLDERDGPPRLTNWVARSDDLDAALAEAPPGAGVPLALSRGPYAWRIAVPPDGRLPWDDLCPALIQWEGEAHPAAALPDHGLRLTRLVLRHPQADALRGWLAPRLDDPRLAVEGGPAGMEATFSTSRGPRILR